MIITIIIIIFIEHKLKGVIQELRDQLFVLEDFKLHKGDYDREMDELRNSMEQGIINTYYYY